MLLGKELDSNKCRKFITIEFVIQLISVIGVLCIFLTTDTSDFSLNQNIGMYIHGFCVILSAIMQFGFIRYNVYTKGILCFVTMNFSCGIALLSDFISWYIEGQTAYPFTLIAKITLSVGLISILIINYSFLLYLIFTFDNERNRIKKWFIRVDQIFVFLGILTAIADIFLSFGYYVDKTTGIICDGNGIIFDILFLLLSSTMLLIAMFMIKVQLRERLLLLSYETTCLLYVLICFNNDLYMIYVVLFTVQLFQFFNIVVQRERINNSNEMLLKSTQKELDIAKQIQTGILPTNFEEYSHYGVDIYASMNAAKEVGGDFYDFFMIDDEKIALVVADVSGKGIPAAMFMMRAKSLIKNKVQTGLSPGTVLTKVNEILIKDNKEKLFVTTWLGIVDLNNHTLQFANAGHNLPVICNEKGEVEFLDNKRNLVLAGMKGIKYQDFKVDMRRDMSIFLYTDGITEAKNLNNEQFGNDRLLHSISGTINDNMKERCFHVRKNLDDFVGDAEQFDDITMITMKINSDEDRTNLISCDIDSESMGKVKSFLQEFIDAKGLSAKTGKNILVIADEIFSNIINYSKATQARVSTKYIKGKINLEFWDNGIPYNPLENEDPDVSLSAQERKIGGLGLFIVKNMTDEMKYERDSGNNVLRLIIKE